jgi:hypothetical protein
MMEAVSTSETLVNFYQTTRCYNPEDSNLHTHRRENLKSYLGLYHLIYFSSVHYIYLVRSMLTAAISPCSWAHCTPINH